MTGFGLVSLLVLAGLFYYPIALMLTVSFTDGFMALRYPTGLRAIADTLSDYVLLAGLFVGIEVLGRGVGAVLDRLLRKMGGPGKYLGLFAQDWVLVLGAVIVAHALGRYYLRNKDELGWFRR
jgi:hypothetical protein